MLAGGQLVGVLFAESPETGFFGYEEEDALCVLASVVANSTDLYDPEPADEPPRAAPRTVAPSGSTVRIRRYAENDSIFVDEDYLIKGIAGAILWRLVRGYVEERRTDYSNRELRLEERCPGLRIEKTGRGRFRLNVSRPLSLAEVRPGTP